MNEKDLIKKAIKELGIDKPIMNHRVVGDRPELHLLGGDTKTFAIAEEPDTPIFLMSKAELAAEAKSRGIKVTSKMTKADIIKALEENSQE